MLDLLKLTALIYLSTLSVSVVAHPDLVLQIQSLDVQLESNPTNSKLLIKRGDLYRRHEDYTAAERDFATARKIDPGNSLLDFYVAHLLFDSGEPQAAEQHFEKYLNSHPQHSKAWALRGETSIRLKQAAAAADYFALAITHAQAAAPALYRSQILSLLSAGQARWADASRVVDEGLERFGLEVSLLGLGIDIALASNQPLKATQYLATLPTGLRSLSQWKTRIQITTCLSSTHVASTDVEASVQCLQHARFQLANEVNAFMAG